MEKALYFLTYNRPDYLARALESWGNVRGIQDWHVVFRVEPSDHRPKVLDIIHEWVFKMELEDYDILLNVERQGVLHHPWVAFTNLFNEGFDFVVHAEDDVEVSEDVLEFFTFCANAYETDKQVSSVHAFSKIGGMPRGIVKSDVPYPGVFGTWRDRWESIIGPTWDHDYSSGGALDSGWDHHYHKRVIPQYNLKTIQPIDSRSHNFGEWGTHSSPEDIEQPADFMLSRPVRLYLETDSR